MYFCHVRFRKYYKPCLLLFSFLSLLRHSHQNGSCPGESPLLSPSVPLLGPRAGPPPAARGRQSCQRQCPRPPLSTPHRPATVSPGSEMLRNTAGAPSSPRLEDQSGFGGLKLQGIPAPSPRQEGGAADHPAISIPQHPPPFSCGDLRPTLVSCFLNSQQALETGGRHPTDCQQMSLMIAMTIKREKLQKASYSSVTAGQ